MFDFINMWTIYDELAAGWEQVAGDSYQKPYSRMEEMPGRSLKKNFETENASFLLTNYEETV
jgi:hypothetical protein